MAAPGTTSALEFAFVDEWELAAEPTEVWSVLRQIDGWPGWWPSVRSVVPLPETDRRPARLGVHLPHPAPLFDGLRRHARPGRAIG